MTQDFQVLKALIVLVPILVVDPKTRRRAIMATTLTAPNPFHKPACR